MTKSKLSFPVILALAAALTASPVVAQGNGNGNGKKNDGPRTELREDRRDRDDRWDDDDDDRRDRDRDRDRSRLRRDGRRVPPGWCIGRGNPHNTPENCGYNRDNRNRDRRWDDRYDRDRRYDDYRRDRRYDDRNLSYRERHRLYHEQHDRECRIRAERAGSLVRRLEVFRQCRAEHDAWHRRQGIRHS